MLHCNNYNNDDGLSKRQNMGTKVTKIIMYNN